MSGHDYPKVKPPLQRSSLDVAGRFVAAVTMDWRKAVEKSPLQRSMVEPTLGHDGVGTGVAAGDVAVPAASGGSIVLGSLGAGDVTGVLGSSAATALGATAPNASAAGGQAAAAGAVPTPGEALVAAQEEKPVLQRSLFDFAEEGWKAYGWASKPGPSVLEPKLRREASLWFTFLFAAGAIVFAFYLRRTMHAKNFVTQKWMGTRFRIGKGKDVSHVIGGCSGADFSPPVLPSTPVCRSRPCAPCDMTFSIPMEALVTASAVPDKDGILMSPIKISDPSGGKVFDFIAVAREVSGVRTLEVSRWSPASLGVCSRPAPLVSIGPLPWHGVCSAGVDGGELEATPTVVHRARMGMVGTLHPFEGGGKCGQALSADGESVLVLTGLLATRTMTVDAANGQQLAWSTYEGKGTLHLTVGSGHEPVLVIAVVLASLLSSPSLLESVARPGVWLQ